VQWIWPCAACLSCVNDRSDNAHRGLIALALITQSPKLDGQKPRQACDLFPAGRQKFRHLFAGGISGLLRRQATRQIVNDPLSLIQIIRSRRYPLLRTSRTDDVPRPFIIVAESSRREEPKTLTKVRNVDRLHKTTLPVGLHATTVAKSVQSVQCAQPFRVGSMLLAAALAFDPHVLLLSWSAERQETVAATSSRTCEAARDAIAAGRWLADDPPAAMRCERGSAFAPGEDCIQGYSCPRRPQ